MKEEIGIKRGSSESNLAFLIVNISLLASGNKGTSVQIPQPSKDMDGPTRFSPALGRLRGFPHSDEFLEFCREF